MFYLYLLYFVISANEGRIRKSWENISQVLGKLARMKGELWVSHHSRVILESFPSIASFEFSANEGKKSQVLGEYFASVGKNSANEGRSRVSLRSRVILESGFWVPKIGLGPRRQPVAAREARLTIKNTKCFQK